MKTAQKIVNNLINKNTFPLNMLKVKSLSTMLRQYSHYFGISNLLKKHTFHRISLQYDVFNFTRYTCLYSKWV